MKAHTQNRQIRSLIAFMLGSACILLSALNLYADDLKILQERTFPTEPGKSLSLNTSSGDVAISTWDRHEVYVKISGNRNAEEKVRFRFDNTGNGVKISAKRDSWIKWLFWSNVYIRYEIKIPANYNAYVNTAGGNVKLNGMTGTARLETSGGNLYLYNTNGKVMLSTSGGDIKLENNNGEIKVETSGGDISSKNFSGNLWAETSGGDIHLDGKSGEVHAATSGGDIYLSYQDINHGIYLETSGGDIVVRVPSNFAAYADLSTSGGEVVCDLPITSKGKMTSSRIKGNLNGGGKPLYCSTTGGDIKVTR